MHGGTCLYFQLLGRLKQKSSLNPGGRGCGELRSCQYTPAWATIVRVHLKKINKKVACFQKQEQGRRERNKGKEEELILL